MAKTLYLRDGSTEVILGDPEKALKRILRERLGPDAVCLLVQVIRANVEAAEPACGWQ